MTDMSPARVMTRTYGQFCPVAVSLDVLGDRWTILLLRDMLWAGPQRFNDLADRNPGLSTSVLADRLRSLNHHGLVEQLDEPKRRYVLTPAGERINGVIDSLYEFGIPFVLNAEVTDEMLAYAVADAARNHRLELMDVEEVTTVELMVGTALAVIEIGPGSMRVVPHCPPAATVRTGAEGLAGLMGGMATVAQAEAAGALTIEGDRALAARVMNLFTPSTGATPET